MTLKQWRLIKGITQQEMADALGVSVTIYARWEHHPESIKLKNADRICEVLGENREDVFPIGGLYRIASKPGGVRVVKSGARTSQNGGQSSSAGISMSDAKEGVSRSKKRHSRKVTPERK